MFGLFNYQGLDPLIGQGNKGILGDNNCQEVSQLNISL